MLTEQHSEGSRASRWQAAAVSNDVRTGESWC